jgi:hypothetical protein
MHIIFFKNTENMKEERHTIIGQWSVIEIEGEKKPFKTINSWSNIMCIVHFKARDSNSSSPCVNLQLQTSKKTTTITQTPMKDCDFA